MLKQVWKSVRKCDQGLAAAWKLGGLWPSWGDFWGTCGSMPQPLQGSEHSIKEMQAFIHELRSAVPNGKVWNKVWTALKGLTQGWGVQNSAGRALQWDSQPKRADQTPYERIWHLLG